MKELLYVKQSLKISQRIISLMFRIFRDHFTFASKIYAFIIKQQLSGFLLA